MSGKWGDEPSVRGQFVAVGRYTLARTRSFRSSSFTSLERKQKLCGYLAVWLPDARSSACPSAGRTHRPGRTATDPVLPQGPLVRPDAAAAETTATHPVREVDRQADRHPEH